MADQSFLESQGNTVRDRDYNVSYKIRRIGFPIVIVTCVILIVVCIVLAVLYSHSLSKHAIVAPEEEAKYKICDEEHCFKIGMEMVKNMNKKIDPCEDFYAYSCEGWQRRNPLKDNTSYNSEADKLNQLNYQIIKKALEQAHRNYSQNVAVMKTVRFYNSCMNVTAAANLGLQPLKDMIQEYGGWSISLNYNSSVTIPTRIGKVFRELNVQSLFGVYSNIDMFDSSKVILKLSGSSIGMSSDSYFKTGEEHLKKRQAYKKLLKTVGRMFETNSTDDKMMAIYDFEEKIARISMGTRKDVDEDHVHVKKRRRVRRSKYDDTRMSLTTFCESSGFSCQLLKETLGVIFRRTFSGKEEIITQPEAIGYAKLIYSLYKTTKESTVADYIMWQAVRKYLWTLPKIYNLTLLEFDKAINESDDTTPLWKKCFDRMEDAFAMTFSLLYVDLNYDDSSKKMIEEMTENVRSSFIERLESENWMDSSTKELVKKKALSIKATIGYPSFIKNQRELEKHYQSLHVTDNLFNNYKAMGHFERMRNLNAYGIPLDKNKWMYGLPFSANAIYFASTNRIVMFAGIIQPPMYSNDFPRYLKYGLLGMIVGHEVTHGFDGQGRMFDSDGNFNNLWSKSSEANFKHKAMCLEKQYSNYKVFDKNVNGSMTLNENIADNGGIRLAYEAYQRWTRKNGPEKRLPGLELNPDQLFFLGFAQGWCSVYSKKAAYHEMEDETHAFGKYRVIGPLSNFNKFSEAFNCPANSPMNPSTKCDIW